MFTFSQILRLCSQDDPFLEPCSQLFNPDQVLFYSPILCQPPDSLLCILSLHLHQGHL